MTHSTLIKGAQLALRASAAAGLSFTVVGATCGAVLSRVLPPGAWALGFGVLIAMLTCDVVRMREGETMRGVGVAWAISLIPKLVRIDESEHLGARHQATPPAETAWLS